MNRLGPSVRMLFYSNITERAKPSFNIEHHTLHAMMDIRVEVNESLFEICELQELEDGKFKEANFAPSAQTIINIKRQSPQTKQTIKSQIKNMSPLF